MESPTAGRTRMKICCTCRVAKPLDEYHKDSTQSDGKRVRCKACTIAQVRRVRATPEGAKRHREAVIKHQATEVGRASNRRATAKWYRNNRHKHRAHREVNIAVDRGHLPSPKTLQCVDCSGPAQEYHHESYEKEHWLDVVPLCVLCHNQRHCRMHHEAAKTA